MKHLQTDNTAYFQGLIEEMDMSRKTVGHKPRPHVEQPHHRDNRMPIDMTKEMTLEVERAAVLVADVGEMISRLPQAERIAAALMELQAVVTTVLAEQVTR